MALLAIQCHNNDMALKKPLLLLSKCTVVMDCEWNWQEWQFFYFFMILSEKLVTGVHNRELKWNSIPWNAKIAFKYDSTLSKDHREISLHSNEQLLNPS